MCFKDYSSRKMANPQKSSLARPQRADGACYVSHCFSLMSASFFSFYRPDFNAPQFTRQINSPPLFKGLTELSWGCLNLYSQLLTNRPLLAMLGQQSNLQQQKQPGNKVTITRIELQNIHHIHLCVPVDRCKCVCVCERGGRTASMTEVIE